VVHTATQHLRAEFFRFLRQRQLLARRCTARRCVSLTYPVIPAHRVARLRERTVHRVTGRDIRCHLRSLFRQHIVHALLPAVHTAHTRPVPPRSADLIIAFNYRYNFLNTCISSSLKVFASLKFIHLISVLLFCSDNFVYYCSFPKIAPNHSNISCWKNTLHFN